jgi:hypothetical protein
MEMEIESSSLTSSSSPLLIQHPHVLYLLKIVFRCLGIATNKIDLKYFQYSMVIIFLGLCLITISSVIDSIVQLSHGHKFQFQIVGVQIWMFHGTIAYGLISYHMAHDYNIFTFLEYLAQPESHPYGRLRTKSAHLLTLQKLNTMSSTWIIFALSLVVASVSGSLITFGPHHLLSTFLPLLHNPLDNFIFIFLYLANLIAPLPMVLVRIGSFFLEQRILGMILFLETEVEQFHTVSITNVMEWYDELYRYNEILTFYLSPFVTLSILVTLPQTIFLLQVRGDRDCQGGLKGMSPLPLHHLTRCQGFLRREGDAMQRITLCVWFVNAAFILLVTICSVAQLDALNRRSALPLPWSISHSGGWR